MKRMAWVMVIGYFLFAFAACGGGGGGDSLPEVSQATVSFSFGVPQKAENNIRLEWTSQNTDACIASDGWTGNKFVSGSEEFYASGGKHSFTMVCYKSGGTSADKTLMVTLPTINFRVPKSVASSTVMPIEWNADADRCVASDGWSGAKAASGSERLSVAFGANKFTIKCYKGELWTVATNEVFVADVSLEKLNLLRFHNINPAVIDNVKYDQRIFATTHRWNKNAIQMIDPLMLSSAVTWYDGVALLKGKMIRATNADIQLLLSEWNQYLGGRLVVVTDKPDPDIAITIVDCVTTACTPGVSGDSTVSSVGYGTEKDNGIYSPQAVIMLYDWGIGISTQTLKRELGRVLGFGYGFTNDRGIMDATHPSMAIGTTTGSTLDVLYSIPPFTYIGN